MGRNIYDIIIVGAGPIGISCGIAAAKKGLSYVIIEKGVIVNTLYHFPVNMTFFSTSDRLEIGGVPFIAHADKPTRREALEYYRRVVESWKLNIHLYETVQDIEDGEDMYGVQTTKGAYHCHSVIIATGFYDTPRMLNVPGEELPKVKHYYDEPHPYIGQDLAIIGAGNSACDVALETFHKGAHVTMIIRKGQIKPSVKYWIKPNIENRISEGSIRAFFHSNVLEITEREILIQTPDEQIRLPNDFVLAMTGYEPDYDQLDRFGIGTKDEDSREPVFDPETFESRRENIYLAGVMVAGRQTGKLFIENTRQHGTSIVDTISRKLTAVSA